MHPRLRAGASRRALAAALCLAATPLTARAAGSDEAPEVDAVIVVGQGDQPITVQPRGLSVSLGETEFQAVNAINVEDLMKYAPNFFVRKRFAGDDNAVVALRGANTVQSARTLVLVDGFVVSNFLGNRWDFPPKWNVVGPAHPRAHGRIRREARGIHPAHGSCAQHCNPAKFHHPLAHQKVTLRGTVGQEVRRAARKHPVQ